MTFTVRFKDKFADEFARLPAELQDRVDDFLDIYEAHGLNDITKYPGKLAQSWHGLAPGHPNYHYTFANDLWHYHVGHPAYKAAFHGKYMTSEWVLHFQWPNWKQKGTHIELVDLYEHYDYDGNFWLPKPEYLKG